ncbi:hypothetical protein LOD99_7975 [Oopsacas minuta]|uniref:Coronin n=1 Tax=Oopsacas minuta TaxID=111878 RepID=A0AAV7JIG3_9METZ|nr:hypothetical protein LOD99_7975 [Oopsacas minuta]
MASKNRHSKFRHVDVRGNKQETCMQNINFFSGGSSDSSICDVSRKFIAVIHEAIGGGSFIVIRLDEYGRYELQHPKVCGHASTVLDVKWSPFNDNIVASCSADGTLKSWYIPDGGLTGSNLTECLVECNAPKKVINS